MRRPYAARCAQTDVTNFPRRGQRLVRTGRRATVYELDSGAPLPFAGFDLL